MECADQGTELSLVAFLRDVNSWNDL
jgi:hypothetical protein